MSILKYSGLRALGAASVAAIVLAACGSIVVRACGSGSSNDALPLIRANLSIKAVSQGGVCDIVPVRITPKELRGEANKYANNRMMVTDVTMTGPTDEAGAPMCNGSAPTLPLAPGDWEFSAPLASGTATCVRDIQAAGDLEIRLIDGVAGCGGPEAAADPLALPAEGEVPADGSAPAAAPATG
ncbi:MAG: hypothetical protein FJ171_04700 [Gammaproteobacteria bacterium]|nr:hypothetical protein [Gammaproteobacteria bacterium]